jgi:hypothetical protein
VHLADLVDHAGVEQDALGQGRLAGVNVRTNPDIPGAFQGVSTVGRIGIGHSLGLF